MTKPSRAHYTLEFKQETACQVDNGQSIAAVARTLGVVNRMLFNWIKAHRKGKLTGADSKPVSAEHMEISRLRAELARVKMERDILEKATAYFARGSISSAPSLSSTAACSLPRWSAAYCRLTPGYYAHLVRRASDAQQRHWSDEALLVHPEARSEVTGPT